MAGVAISSIAIIQVTRTIGMLTARITLDIDCAGITRVTGRIEAKRANEVACARTSLVFGFAANSPALSVEKVDLIRLDSPHRCIEERGEGVDPAR